MPDRTASGTSLTGRGPLRGAKPDEREAQGAGGIRRSPVVRYLTVALTVALITLMFPHQSVMNLQFRTGSIWTGDTLRAPFAFPLHKDEALYLRQCDSARSSVLPVFVESQATWQSVSDSLKGYLERLPQTLPQGTGSGGRMGAAVRECLAALDQALGQLYRNGVIGERKSALATATITVRRGAALQETLPVATLYDTTQVMQAAEEALAGLRSRGNPLSVAPQALAPYLRPTLLYSAALTERARQEAIESIPRSYGVVAQNQLIVAPGESVTPDIHAILTSLQYSRQLRQEGQPAWRQIAGNVGYVLILLALGSMYLYYFRPRILRDNLQIAIISVALLATAFMGYLSLTLQVPLPVEFLILMPAFSMLLAILFDSRTAFYLTVVACFIVAGVRGNDYTVAIACLVAGVLAAYTVRDIKSRTQLFRSIGFAMLGYLLAILALGLQQGNTFTEIGTRCGLAAINAIISPVLTFGALLLIETLFGVATDLKLLEYDNLNHPLLRALADKAPGTYQHTLSIARLCERAAVAIGANPLLAKVGAYYHDIGKIAKPEYFVENQMGMENKHDRIKPEQSARVIRDHVSEGIRLAQEYKLPQRIADFIPMHHGTTAIQYFLDKARQAGQDIDTEPFYYPGPRPNSRETAILMLADATEAITRTLARQAPQDIGDIVEDVVKRRMDEGQLDECNLTLADLAGIKEAFVKNLIGVQHPRVKYDADTEEDRGQKSPPGDESRTDDAFGNTETRNVESPID